jgi:hypothetical protein
MESKGMENQEFLEMPFNNKHRIMKSPGFISKIAAKAAVKNRGWTGKTAVEKLAD